MFNDIITKKNLLCFSLIRKSSDHEDKSESFNCVPTLTENNATKSLIHFLYPKTVS